MNKGPSTLLKQCLKCGMQFDSYEHLASHQKRFCNDGEFGTIQKLENKYQEYTNPRHEQMPAGSSHPKTGASPDRNADFQRLYNSEMQTRNNQMENDINRIKQEKAAIRLRKQEEEQALADVMQASEQNKEKNLRTRFEKEQIVKDIRDLDKHKLNYLEVEKKNQLEHIAAERELLRQKEQQLSGDLVRYENEAKAMARIREEDIRRQDDALDKLRKRGDENTKVQDILLHEKSDRVAELRMRRENLEFEKQRLAEDQEKIRNGDFAGARRPNYGLYSANQMLGTIGAIKNYDIGNARQAITNDQQRIANMKNDQQNIVRNEHIYPDFLHASPPSNKYDSPYGKPYGSPNTLLNNTTYATPDRVNGSSSLLKRSPTTGSPFTNNANNILSPSGSIPNHLLNSHSPYQGPAVLPEHVQAQSLGEVLQLQNRYINGGGQDPNVLKNFESLENFYRGVASQAHTRPIDNTNSNQGNPQLQHMIDQKEQDNLKLKHELEMLKMQNAKLPSAVQSGNFTIADMNLKLNGMDAQKKNIFSIYTGGTEFFIQNEARNVDLNEHERMAVNLSSQEADALRMLSQLPIGTELYRFKLEQYKELSQLRSETEKILQEQRLLEMRRNFEKVRRDEDRKYENERWVDEQRKNIIGNRLRKDLNPPKVAKGYDPTEGFIIHWDYLLSVPKRNDSCQVVYGIYINGNEVYPPSMVEPHPCEVDTSVTNRCIFGKSHPVAEIPANANALLIFEVQLFPSKDSTNPRLTSFGWSQLDLFDARRELKRGKFKVPLYECPTDTNQDIDGIRDLTPVQNGVSWLYLRISYPFDDDVGKVASIYPENTHMEYNIPQIHLRNYRPALEGQFQGGPPGGYMQDYPPQTRKTTPSVAYQPHQYPPYNNQPQQQPPYDQSNMNNTQFLNPPPGGNGQGRSPGGDNDGGRSKLFPDDDRAGTPQNQTVFGPGDKRALQFVIHAVRGHVARSHLKISCALYEEDQIVMDDFGQKCVYNTTTHNPLDLNKKDVSIMGGKMNNKAQGQDIIFKEEHVFMKDLNRLIQKNHGKKDYYLMFQILEKPEPTKIQTDSQNISYKVSETANYGGMEYDLYGWFLFKLNKAEGGVNVGKFMRKMFAPGLRQPPLDMSKIKTLDNDLEFAVNEIPWPEDDEDHSPDQTVNMSVATTKKNKTSKKGKKGTKSKGNKSMSKSKINTSSVNKTMNSGPADFELINDPFIPNTKPQYIDRTFEKGMGVDFYIDGCRFLPDNVTVTKIAVQIVNVDFDIIKSAESNLPDLTVSTTYNPLFNFRIEIRPQNFNPTALAFISIDTIDKASNATKIVGYSGINLFINRFSGKQPDNQNDTDIVLLSGNYQLPIYCQEPFRTKPFNMEKIESLERLPTASILVRIRQAPLSDDGLRVLNLRDVPRKEWAAKQIWVPRPVYAAKAYNTSNYRIKDSEKELFKIRQGKEDPPLRETAQLLLNAENINKEMDDEELVGYLNNKINRNSATGLIDLLYFAKYRPEAGFKFALDGIHNVTVAQPYIGLYSLNPPGDFYVYEDGDEPNTSKLQLNSVLQWDGPLLSPKFLDGYMTFKDIVFSKNLHLIIDIRTVNLMKHPPQFSHIGWTIVPLFTPDGFVLSGIYQIPLIAGEVNKAIVQELPENDPWGFILDQIKAKKIKWLGQASAMIRLIDAQREGHYEQSWDFTRVDYRYLPKKDLQKYAYNNNADAKAKAGKILQSIVPNKGNPQAYQKRITQAFVTELGLTQYQSELS